MTTQQPTDVPAIEDWSRLLDGRVAVITGGGDGIGGAISRLFAAHGAKVEIAEIEEERAERAVSEIREAGGSARAHVLDVRKDSAVAELRDAVVAEHGGIDVLVNNVGGTIWMKPFHLYTEDEVEHELERSLKPTLWGCRAVLPIMMQQGAGSIVNLGSQSVRGLYRLPYAASKGGILALGKVLAMEYGRYGIRVNTVSPGGTDIPDRVTSRLSLRPGVMAADLPQQEGDDFRREMSEDIRNQQSLRRRGMPEEQAAAVAFLASDDASFITGDVINCSGGQS